MLRSSLFLLFFSVIYVSATISYHNPYYCYSRDPIRPQIGMFAKQSAYDTSRGRNIDPNVTSCKESKFWLLNRHGTRLPKSKELKNMLNLNEDLHKGIIANYDAGRTSLCSFDMNLLREWSFDSNITTDKDQYLTTSGWDELKGIAKRFQEAYPTLLPKVYSPSHYFFRVTNKQRTLASIRAFADGLFGFNGFEDVHFEDIPSEDVLLRPHDYCKLYESVIKNNIEKDEFLEGPEYQEMVVQVSAKLGFHGSHQLSIEEVQTLLSICKYEQIWYMNSISPMCAAFSVANQQVHEYSEDLDFYYEAGYGFTDYRRLIENINCNIMQDMLKFLRSDDPTDPKAKIFGAHSTTLLFILVTFGAFEDEIPLTRHNFADQRWRQWRMSHIAPMASNLAAIRYDCDDGDNEVLFLFNEKPLEVDGCDNGLCKVSLILDRFSRFIDGDCSEIYCNNSI